MQMSSKPLQRYGERDVVKQRGNDRGQERTSIPLSIIPGGFCTYFSQYLKYMPPISTSNIQCR